MPRVTSATALMGQSSSQTGSSNSASVSKDAKFNGNKLDESNKTDLDKDADLSYSLKRWQQETAQEEPFSLLGFEALLIS